MSIITINQTISITVQIITKPFHSAFSVNFEAILLVRLYFESILIKNYIFSQSTPPKGGGVPTNFGGINQFLFSCSYDKFEIYTFPNCGCLCY